MRVAVWLLIACLLGAGFIGSLPPATGAEAPTASAPPDATPSLTERRANLEAKLRQMQQLNADAQQRAAETARVIEQLKGALAVVNELAPIVPTPFARSLEGGG